MQLSYFQGGVERMIDIIPINLILLPIFMAIPLILLYFIIKLAIKNAIKELKKENIL